MQSAQLRGKKPLLEHESHFWERGYRAVAGLDEAGRGAWAGPVYAGAVILAPQLPAPPQLSAVRDSKQLSPAQREAAFAAIQTTALAWAAGWASAVEIDALGIVPATRLAMTRALVALPLLPDALLIDALRLPEIPLPQQSFPFADALALTVAAASIVAKVSRDRWMRERAEVDFGGYGFAQHKGYGTRQHQAALAARGPCALHRRSFAPIATLGDKERGEVTR
ncbi:MAG TPA: ribonuclease HII [Anaerolineae bacterium]|nr:ribonuclease HII [Anaerolineae bacterium]HQM13012.1 ribonuclease HII [Anaerolineae bacterium]